MIYFQKIKFRNFLSYGNYWTTVDIRSHKMNLIVGKNGNGKSVITDSLVFGLFGRPYRKINKPNLVNSINRKGLEVEIYFSITENSVSKQYMIRRGLKPNIFEIFIDDEKQNEKDNVRDQQKYLEENILKTNFRTFTQIILLGSASYVPFMHLTTSQRREFIENLLDIDIFSTMNNVLKQRNMILKELKERTEHKKSNIESLIQKQKSLVEKLSEQKENEESSIQNEIDLQQKRIDAQQKEIDKLTAYAQEILDKKEKLNESYLKEQKQKLSGKLSDANASIKRLNKDNKFMESHTSCPTCKQNISNEHKNNYIAESTQEIQKLETVYSAKNTEYENITKQLNDLQSLSNEYFQTETKINSAKSNQSNIQKDIERLEKKRDAIDIGDVTKEEKQLEKYKSDKERYKEQQKIISSKDELYRVAFDLLKDNGIKSRIISQYIPIINKLINQYLTEMNFYVTFTLDETFNEQILSRYRDEFTYDNFSQGEKMRIDIALLMVWRNIAEMKNSIHTNILLLDEVFDASLDEDGIEDFLKILNGVSKNNNVYIISHKVNQLNSKFDRVFTIQKMNDFSYLEVEET